MSIVNFRYTGKMIGLCDGIGSISIHVENRTTLFPSIRERDSIELINVIFENLHVKIVKRIPGFLVVHYVSILVSEKPVLKKQSRRDV